MIKIGCCNTLKAGRRVDFGVYLTDGSEEILLPRKYVPANLETGDQIEVFVYMDSSDRPIATTRKPLAMVGEFALLQVKDVNRFGAFLDWGLEKDLFVPFKEQGDIRMIEGRSYVVRVCYDKVSGRLTGSMRYRRHAKLLAGSGMWPGLEVEIMVLEPTQHGFNVLVNSEYLGKLYERDLYHKVKIGEKTTGWISKIRPDGKLDITLRKPGFEGVCEQKPLVLEKLKAAGGSLPYNSKSTPEEIKREFAMSKKAFKQIIGNLYKERIIKITDEGIELADRK
ncbi:S1-like domain-containing RNA-binding protein [Lentisphaerota bacterium ZTH]|nr:GntR family transcriptional regulator [Lentisphaerota bacterium]WET05764.1 S1-like domain-containing RNA-binding protein [Lentisphaerota bacterium ZTH]